MTSARKLIRHAIRDRLKDPVSGLPGAADAEFRTDAKGSVFKSRTHRLFKKDLPAILIYTRSERVADDRNADGQAEHSDRDLRVGIEGVIEADEDVDDRLDELAEQIEVALWDFEIPGFETASIDLTETDVQVIGEGEEQTGGVRLTYSVKYTVARPIPPICEPPGEVWFGIAPKVGAAHVDDYTLISSPEGFPP